MPSYRELALKTNIFFKADAMESGILIVDKPGGCTSHDVVAGLRRALKKVKVGHGGTLDPMATGVLPMFIGKATRLSRFFLEMDKEYDALVRFGWATDTYDAEGSPLAEERGLSLGEADIDGIVQSFRGLLRMPPPPYSAVKIRGRHLYEYARKGEDIEVAERETEVVSCRVMDWSAPLLKVHIHCSKGTYIRSIAHEMGVKAGCGAHLSALRRVRSGPFGIGEAIPLADALADLPAAGGRVLPLDSLLSGWPCLTCPPAWARRVRGGNSCAFPLVGCLEKGGRVRLTDEGGHLIAVGVVLDVGPGGAEIHPDIVLDSGTDPLVRRHGVPGVG